jgi:capsular exopolysaccharide synthesis family protein
MFDSLNRHPNVDKHLVGLLSPRSFEAEQYRRLRQQIELARAQRQWRVFAITSPVVSDGKTLTSVNLAAVLAGGSNRVLLIDADLRRPSVARMLGIDTPSAGLAAALNAPPAELPRFIHDVEGTRLSVLACTVPCADTYELLTSPQMAELLGRARAQYDYVILDTPPVVPVPDSGLLRPLVDGYVVVVSARSTPRRLLGEALNQLDEASVLGVVLNRDVQPLFGFYRARYRQYFQNYVRAIGDA